MLSPVSMWLCAEVTPRSFRSQHFAHRDGLHHPPPGGKMLEQAVRSRVRGTTGSDECAKGGGEGADVIRAGVFDVAYDVNAHSAQLTQRYVHSNVFELAGEKFLNDLLRVAE